MKSYDIYNKKEKKADSSKLSSVADFFRKEIIETRVFTRSLTASKSYAPKIDRLVKTVQRG